MIPLFATLVVLQATPSGGTPDVFRGAWAERAEDCAYPPLRAVIDSQGVHPGAVIRHPAAPGDLSEDAQGLHWSHTRADPESGVWVTRYVMSPPQGDRATLARDGKDGLRTFVLVRCPSASAP